MIIDDEDDGRHMVAEFLKDYPGFEIVSQCKSADEALKAILQHQPGLIFLDIEMPGKSGFDLIAELKQYARPPHIIFVTAFNRYAVQAFKASAFDYLVKPIDKEEFRTTILRYTTEKSDTVLAAKIDNLLECITPEKKIRFNTQNGFTMVDPSGIIYCEADWNYTDLHFPNNKKIVVSMNIGKVLALLDPRKFCRISRSILINLSFLVSVDRKKRQCLIKTEDRELTFHIPLNHLRELENRL